MDETRDAGMLATDAAAIELSRELIVATGADRVRFLQGIVTADVAKVAVGGGVHAALLTAKAHLVADLRIFVRPQEVFVVVDAGLGAPTAAELARYAIMDDFQAAVRPGYGFLAVLGPRAADRLAAAGVALAPGGLGDAGTAPLAHGTAGPLFVARVRQLGADGFWLGGADDDLAALRRALGTAGVRRLAPDVAEAARVAAGEPAWGREMTPDYFPMEVGLGDAIDYGKGCFLGQEPIVRIRDRGHTNWRLVRLAIDSAQADGGDALPAPGDRLETDAKPKAGKVTSVARLDDGRAVALALAHVSVPAGAPVRVVSAAGTAPPLTATIVGG